MLGQVGHIGRILGPCWAYVGLCRLYVGPMLAYVCPILAYVGPVLALCRPYVGLCLANKIRFRNFSGLRNQDCATLWSDCATLWSDCATTIIIRIAQLLSTNCATPRIAQLFDRIAQLRIIGLRNSLVGLRNYFRQIAQLPGLRNSVVGLRNYEY